MGVKQNYIENTAIRNEMEKKRKNIQSYLYSST